MRRADRQVRVVEVITRVVHGAGVAGGRIAIGLGSGPAALLTAPLLLQLARSHPGLRVDLSTGSIELLMQALRERKLDALVFEVRALAPTPDLSVEPLAELPGAFLSRRGHPLLQRTKPARFADLQRHRLASTPLGPEVARVLVERYGREAHPDTAVTLRAEDITSLVEVVKKSDAVLLAVRATAPALAIVRPLLQRLLSP